MASKQLMSSIPNPNGRTEMPIWMRTARAVTFSVAWAFVALLTLWAVAALLVDFPIPALRIPITLIYLLGIITIFVKLGRSRWAAIAYLLGFGIVLAWWLTLKPSNDADWQPNVDRTAWAEIAGDRVTIHNLRNCDYRTETDYADCWSDRTVYLSQIRAADLFLTNWGIPFASHPIISFQFGDNEHVAFSIEARYKAGQAYSTVLGCFRQYELIFVTADERDLIRLRTNYRKDEEVSMYRLQAAPEVARRMFLTYLDYLNRLSDHPEWYNEVTRNCTTTINRQLGADVNSAEPWNYQYLLNGTLDRLLYDRGRLVTGGLAFPELKQREHINEAARASTRSDFSASVRLGRVGF